MYIKFLDSDTLYSGKIRKVKPHVISVTCDVINTSGLNLFLDAKGKRNISGNAYENFTTIYKNDGEDLYGNPFVGYFLSDNGSVYVPKHIIIDDKED